MNDRSFVSCYNTSLEIIQLIRNHFLSRTLKSLTALIVLSLFAFTVSESGRRVNDNERSRL